MLNLLLSKYFRSVPKAHRYVCHGDKSCEIGVATRKNCQYCRFQACLRQGMRTSWVLTENEKIQRMERKKSKISPSTGTEDPSLISSEQELLASLVTVGEEINSQESMPQHIIQEVVKCATEREHAMPRWATFEFYAVQYSRTAKLATSISDFNQISVSGERRASFAFYEST